MPYGGPLNASRDPYYIPNPDSTRHYRWIADNPRAISLWTRSFGSIPGYRLELGKETAERLGFSEDMVSPLGRIFYGFNILASIPIEEHDRRQKEKLDDMISKVTGIRERFAAAIDNVPGAKPLLDDVETLLDKKAHATRESNNRVFVSRPRGGRSQDTGV